MSLNTETSGSHSPQDSGFYPDPAENNELAKVQLRQSLETAEEDLADAMKRVEDAKTDEMIDMEAAQALVTKNQEELNKLQAEWDNTYGAETSH